MRNRSVLPFLAFGAGVVLARTAVRRIRRYDLENKNVLITGGSRGLGLAMAFEFASRGAKVSICARDAGELELAKAQIQAAGHQVNTATCDITQEEAANALIQELEIRNGPLDVLVNNAGRIEVGPLETATIADFEKAMETHFWGPLYLMRASIPGMRCRGAGRIVNIASIGGKIGVPHLAAYDSSKFSVAGLSEAMAAELRRENIRVTTVYPGLMRTGSPRNASFKGQHRKEYTWFALSDSLPLITIGAARAARKIVDACCHGQPSLVITPAAKAAVLLHALAPNATITALSMVNRILPKAPEGGETSHKGHESETLLTRSPLTLLDQRAAGRFNQLAKN